MCRRNGGKAEFVAAACVSVKIGEEVGTWTRQMIRQRESGY